MPIRAVQSVFRDGVFDGKVAIVTGGGTGIGKCIAHELASLGCSVVIAARNLDRLHAAVAEIKSELSPKHAARDCVFAVACDVRKESDVKNLMDQTMQKYKRIDHVVNNAGGQFISPFEDLTLKGWEAVHRLNLTGTFLVTKYAHEAYLKENGGSIVNILVNMAKGFPGSSHSGSSRAAVENLTKSLAVEWAQYGIRLNSVAPGTILSSGVGNYFGGAELFERLARKFPAQRMGTVEEVAAATVFLLSPAASYTTGTTTIVDGAMYLEGNFWETTEHDNFPVYGKSKL
ncbi:peroxisomal trans-2-enoyl-CoA reductase [Achlya hypogyna]|uniref:Peroxisomal trans-2-enoyl-CoA reductase n=1 Tax=Achlya hypogyna TaxID=1202772 RepID=A0A1V9YAV0_ACHHY|nr:peroxisomal trans-2-enoyl-CoA reductase [Achlya hypogyna]